MPDDQAVARRAVCSEILDIMAEYDRQVKEDGYYDTPGGLEHMGDVWGLFRKWQGVLKGGKQ
jgi:hypothetical protein